MANFLVCSKPMAAILRVALRSCACGALLLLPVGSLVAQETNSDASQSPWQWLESTRDQVSRNVTAFGRNLDEWLAGESIAGQTNETVLRVRLNQIAGTFDGYSSKLKVGGRLDLPLMSERWKLIFDSDVDELNSLEDNVLNSSTSSESIGGFRYQNETESGWKFSHDIGLKAKVPVDPFYRFRAVYGFTLSENWSMGFSQKIWYYNSDGWGYDTELAFNRTLTDSSFLRFTSEVNFEDDENEMEFAQSLALYQTRGVMETISYEAGILGSNYPNRRINAYFTQVRYRKAIYEDWLIIEAVPQILVARDESWRPQPRFMMNLELLFFDI